MNQYDVLNAIVLFVLIKISLSTLNSPSIFAKQFVRLM